MERPLALARAALARQRSPFSELPPRLVLVDVARQRLSLIEDGRETGAWPVSTAAAGVGGADGSLRTPPGWHCIHQRIGVGSPSGAVFRSRVATGELWSGQKDADDLILTRILTLDGLEDGINRGAGTDSLARYIYIHGTNHEDDLGRAASHGCVRMGNRDVIDLFDRVREGDPVAVVDMEEATPLA